MSNRVLTLEEIEVARAETRTRGEYEVKVDEFFESGELAWDFSLMFPGKEEGNLRNNVTKYAKAHEPKVPFQILMVPNEGDKKHVVLLNLDTYHLEQQKNEA